MSELPQGWAQTRLGALGRYINGRGFKSTEWSSKGRPIIRIQNLTGTSCAFNLFDGEVAPRYVVRAGDLLISWAATLGAYFWPGPEGLLNQHIFRVESHIHLRFHKYLVDHVLGDLNSKTHGSGIVHITRGPFDDTPILLPPLAEQARIVAAIEEQFSRLDAGVAALERVRLNLKRMRAAVLAAACSGRLTALWRDASTSKQTGTELLQDLLSERTDRSSARSKSLTEPTPATLVNLPASWTHASIDQLCSLVTDGEHITPPRTSTGVMLLSARNVQNGYLSFDTVDHISEETYIRLAKRLDVTAGDVLLSCSGSVGRSSITPDGIRFALVRSVAVLRPIKHMGNFISLMLRSPQIQEQIMERKTETAQANIFQRQIRGLTLPLPSVAEQDEIVQSIEQHMTLISALEKTLDIETRRTASLRSSILAAAFSGKLVPQDPSDEPASVLLERIAAEQESTKRRKA